jgi:hypothetical protein
LGVEERDKDDDRGLKVGRFETFPERCEEGRGIGE